MTQKITYPLKVAIDLSPTAGALYDAPEGQVHVETLEGWFIHGELHNVLLCEEADDYEWCYWYLMTQNVPVENGWLPQQLAFLEDE